MCQWLGVMTMSDVRWIKIYTNMFDNRKIKQIEKLPKGNALLVTWLKLLTLAGNVNDSGFVYFTKDIPYTDQMLATEFDMPLSTIQLALNVFKQYEMIDITDDLLKISNWEKYQNVEGMEKIREQNRIRKQNQRLREKEAKQIECHVTRHDEVTQSHATDIDIDIEKDIDIDINKDINKDIENKIIDLLSSSRELYIYMKLEEEYEKTLKMMIKAGQVTKVIPDQGRLEDLMKEIIFNREDVSNKQGYLVECFKHEGDIK